MLERVSCRRQQSWPTSLPTWRRTTFKRAGIRGADRAYVVSRKNRTSRSSRSNPNNVVCMWVKNDVSKPELPLSRLASRPRSRFEFDQPTVGYRVLGPPACGVAAHAGRLGGLPLAHLMFEPSACLGLAKVRQHEVAFRCTGPPRPGIVLDSKQEGLEELRSRLIRGDGSNAGSCMSTCGLLAGLTRVRVLVGYSRHLLRQPRPVPLGRWGMPFGECQDLPRGVPLGNCPDEESVGLARHVNGPWSLALKAVQLGRHGRGQRFSSMRPAAGAAGRAADSRPPAWVWRAVEGRQQGIEGRRRPSSHRGASKETG